MMIRVRRVTLRPNSGALSCAAAGGGRRKRGCFQCFASGEASTARRPQLLSRELERGQYGERELERPRLAG
jgi:hypothetical protein